jgi:uncharacterized protein (DUF1015 family)
MAIVKPFKGLRPKNENVHLIASPPYDVLTSKEARASVADNPLSFLHITKPEIDLPETTDPYSPEVYKKGKLNLDNFIAKGLLHLDKKSCFYLYQQKMNGHIQTGLVALVSLEEYEKNIIRKHELTKFEKENDRFNHIITLKAQTGPVLMTYRQQPTIEQLLNKIITDEPAYHFIAEDNIEHVFWIINDDDDIKKLTTAFAKIDFLYIADGHHRSAAAQRTQEYFKNQNPAHTGEESYNFFMAVLFPHTHLNILDYNRVVKDLNGHNLQSFLEKLSEKFLVREFPTSSGYRPVVNHDFGMYLSGKWYRLSGIPGTWDENSPIDRLDVSILYNNILNPILGIKDARQDSRIDYVGGSKGLAGLESLVNSGEMTIAFSLHPTAIQDLLEIADQGAIMPPKSTWFEPKLRSGLVAHLL